MIFLSFGTRPEWIKIKPLVDIFSKNNYPHKVLFTGQHTTLLPAGTHGLIDISLVIGQGGNRLDSIVKSVMNQSAVWLENPSHILVQGDTTSAFSLALAAFHRRVPVIHLEAGLRTYDMYNPYPEEFNRQAISKIASLHFCPTDTSAENLRKEGIDNGIFVTGNTVLDNLTDIPVKNEPIIPITMHRRENHDKMALWFREFEELAQNYSDYKFIFPMHPNPNVQKHKDILKSVEVCDPMHYYDFVRLLSSCKMIISDSGGIQEEASFFKKRVIVCRKKTERVEGLGTFFDLCKEPSDLEGMFVNMLNKKPIDDTIKCPFGGGHAAENIYELLKEKQNDY